MQSLLPEARKQDSVIVAVSPDSVNKIKDVIPKVRSSTHAEFTITLLRDDGHQVIDRYGLLNEAAAKRNRFIPHPTTLVIDKSGVVRWRFTEVDYKIRPSNEMVLAELEKLE